MRSTRASAAWAGIALATSFLSVTIVGTHPRTSTTPAIAARVAMTSTRDALSSDALKRANVAESNATTHAD